MGILFRTLACLGILVASVAPLAAFEGPTTAAANDSAGAPAEEAKSSVSTAQRMIEAGVKSYDEGKMNQAIRAFTKALKGGGLNNAQTARALYYRGLAYRRQEKPAQAISDLSRAAWMKDGLNATEQQNALSNRVGAYQDAGISNVPSLTPAPAAFASDASGWSTAMNGETLAPPVAPPVSSIAPAPPPATLSATPTASPPASSSGSGGVSGFFSSITNMFSSSSSSSNDSPPPPPPSNTPVTSTAALSGDDTAAPAAGWTTTEVGSSPLPPVTPPVAEPVTPPPAPAASETPAFVTQVAKAPAPPPAAAPSSAASGNYLVQVAAVRTREEAYALSVRLMSQHASELGGRRPSVDETVIGSMGTFYRVRLGPYASAEESENLCGSIRSSGFDCLVVTQ